MSAATPNVAASVRARLLNVAKAQGVDFNQVLVRFALERILYRLSTQSMRLAEGDDLPIVESLLDIRQSEVSGRENVFCRLARRVVIDGRRANAWP